MIVLAVDPGVKGCGWSLFDDDVLLVADYAKADDIVLMVRTWEAKAREFGKPIGRVVVEMPQTYGGRAAIGDTNDLLSLSVTVGGIRTLFETSKVPVVLIKARQWKGQMKKEVVHTRVRESIGGDVLSIAKRFRDPKKRLAHNVWDAIGIGLWWIKKGARQWQPSKS